MAERLTDVQRFVQLCSASERKSLPCLQVIFQELLKFVTECWASVCWNPLDISLWFPRGLCSTLQTGCELVALSFTNRIFRSETDTNNGVTARLEAEIAHANISCYVVTWHCPPEAHADVSLLYDWFFCVTGEQHPSPGHRLCTYNNIFY